jgi:hypothetical protein
MLLKRKISTSAAASTSALPPADHPLLKQVAVANASKTRDHLASYHRVVDNCKQPSLLRLIY